METNKLITRKQKRFRLAMNSFPAYDPLLMKALKYTAESGCRFLKQDVKSAKMCVDQKTEPRSKSVALMMELLPTIYEFRTRIIRGDNDLKQQCAKAQRAVVRAGVEKACLSAVHQLDIDPVPNIKGEDWDDLEQPFLTCGTKLLNFFEGSFQKDIEHQQMLLTGMFITDFGLWCGISKVSCVNDEKLLSDFLDMAAQFSKEQGKDFSYSEIPDSTLSGLLYYIPPGIQDNISYLGDTVFLTGKAVLDTGLGLSGAVLETGIGVGAAVLGTGKDLGGAVLGGFGMLGYSSAPKDGTENNKWKASNAKSSRKRPYSGSGLTTNRREIMDSYYETNCSKKSYSERNMGLMHSDTDSRSFELKEMKESIGSNK